MSAASRLLFRSLLMVALVTALVAAFVLIVPDGNDYALATLDKHERLGSIEGRKMVFVGGSNLAFGLDSEMVERELGMGVVNMGMNAFLGLRFFIDEVEPQLESGDVLVVALETVGYLQGQEFDAIDGAGLDHLAMVKARPGSMRALKSVRQWRRLMASLPYAAQAKALRLIESSLLATTGRLPERHPILLIETRDGFNRWGDLVSHLDRPWELERHEGADLAGFALDERVFRHLAETRDRLATRGVELLVIPTPIPKSYYRSQEQTIELIAKRLDETVGPGLLIAPSDMVFEDHLFYDDIYHLGRSGRQQRTERLIEPLIAALAREVRSES